MLAISEAMGAGVTIQFPIVSLFAAYKSIEGFKSAAEQYCEAIDIQKEARDLLKMERDLEKIRERNGRER